MQPCVIEIKSVKKKSTQLIKPNYFFYTWTALVKDLRQNQSNEERVIALADRITNLTNRMHQLSFDRTENNAALIQTHSCAVTMWNIAVAMKTGGQQSGTTYNAKCKSLCLMISSIIAIVNKGNGYEGRQTSKEHTNMPRFMLEGLWPCTIFCFALIHYAWRELRDQHFSIG